MTKTDEMENELRQEVIKAAIKYYEAKHKRAKKTFASGDSIPYGGRVFDENEIICLIDSALDFWLTADKFANKFENEFAQFQGITHCLLTNSGSSANLLAFMALTSPSLDEKRVIRGDEVITTAAGFPTTVSPIINYGAVPVFVDVTFPTYNIDISQLENALGNRTKAVLIAHTMGNPFDLKDVVDFCNKHNLWLIEDNCDALGSKYLYEGQWKYTGNFGHISTSSFYPAHHITTGEGGAVCTNSEDLKQLIASFRDWGRDCWCASGYDNTCNKRFKWKLGELPEGYDHKYIYSHFGYNLKITDMQAAIGCAQLKKLPVFIETRKKNWKLLRNGLSDLSDSFILPEATLYSDPSWFGFLLTIREDAGFDRNEIVSFLESNAIQTRMLFAGNLLKQPCFDEMRTTNANFRIIGDLRNTDIIMNQTFWVGVSPLLTDEMIGFVVDTIRKFVKMKT